MINEIVKTEHNLVYDESDPHCKFFFSRTQGQAYGFVQCLDVGPSGKSRRIRRVWGRYADSLDNKENAKSIHNIMNTGSPWPALPEVVY